MVSATSTPIKSGDPIWVTSPGEEQAEPGVLVLMEPGKNGATVQLLKDSAGAHSLVEPRRISYRRAGDDQARAQMAPKPIAEASTDPFDQLIALFPKVIERLQADVREGKERRDRKMKEVETEAQSYRELKGRRGIQIGRVETALKVLTRPTRAGRVPHENPHKWTPKQREAASQRMIEMNRARGRSRL